MSFPNDIVYIKGANGQYILTRDSKKTYNKEAAARIEADCRLIAAAPDLLEAVQKLLTYGTFDDYPNTSEWYAVRDARAAIAKATGETA
jgi:hypothetical protein